MYMYDDAVTNNRSNLPQLISEPLKLVQWPTWKHQKPVPVVSDFQQNHCRNISWWNTNTTITTICFLSLLVFCDTTMYVLWLLLMAIAACQPNLQTNFIRQPTSSCHVNNNKMFDLNIAVARTVGNGYIISIEQWLHWLETDEKANQSNTSYPDSANRFISPVEFWFNLTFKIIHPKQLASHRFGWIYS